MREVGERMQAVERNAHYVKEHPNTWKAQHTAFINAQFQKQEQLIKELLKQKNGIEKIQKLYNIKNPQVLAALRHEFLKEMLNYTKKQCMGVKYTWQKKNNVIAKLGQD